jgi:N,N'-diacetyllegionaminate synthase
MGHHTTLGAEGRCFIVAEVGINHKGHVKLARQLIDAAKTANADAVKFQTFDAEELVTRRGRMADFQTRSKERTQLSMLRRLQLSQDEFKDLKAYSDRKGIEFFSTPYDIASVDFLDNLGVRRFKVSSTDLTNRPLIEAIARTHRQVILSTGMATLAEVRRTVDRIRDMGNDDLVILHATTGYPTPPDQVNMRAMQTLAREFPYPVGYSDHTIGTEVAIMAVSLGARVLEKHLTLDRRMEGPDHYASVEPAELRVLVRGVRAVEEALGTGEKVPSELEVENMPHLRRSLHAARELRKGTVLTMDDLRAARPYDGIDPWDVDRVLGRRLDRDRKRDAPITFEDLEHG